MGDYEDAWIWIKNNWGVCVNDKQLLTRVNENHYYMEYFVFQWSLQKEWILMQWINGGAGMSYVTLEPYI